MAGSQLLEQTGRGQRGDVGLAGRLGVDRVVQEKAAARRPHQGKRTGSYLASEEPFMLHPMDS